jgi:hypothetical protein
MRSYTSSPPNTSMACSGTAYLTIPPISPSLIYLIILTIFGEEYKRWSTSLRNFPQPPVTSSLFGPNILPRILFSETLNMRSSLNVRQHVSQPYKTAGKIA